MEEQSGKGAVVKKWEEFETEVANLLRINFEVATLSEDTPLFVMDSLAVTEVMTLAEEHLGVECTYAEVKACKTFGDLRSFLAVRWTGE